MFAGQLWHTFHLRALQRLLSLQPERDAEELHSVLD